MERSTFLKGCSAAAALFLAPFSMMAHSIKKYREANGFLVKSGNGRLDKTISLFEGDTFYNKI